MFFHEGYLLTIFQVRLKILIKPESLDLKEFVNFGKSLVIFIDFLMVRDQVFRFELQVIKVNNLSDFQLVNKRNAFFAKVFLVQVYAIFS